MVLFIKNVRYLNKKFKKIKEENRKLVKDQGSCKFKIRGSFGQFLEIYTIRLEDG